MTDTMTLETGSPIARIELNQPAKRNAISAAMWRKLGEAVRVAEADKLVTVIVVSGAGDHFAAGADISEFAEVYATAESAQSYTNDMLASLATLESCRKPTIAQIRGACVGGGCSIALACDFRFVADTARIGVTPGKLGLVYSLADTRRLVSAVGVQTAKDLLFTGRLIDAEEAKSSGFAHRLVNVAALEAEVIAFGDAIATTSQWSVHATKQMLSLLHDAASDDDPRAAAIMLAAFDGEDFKEGYRAFLEKRKPAFPST